MAAAAVAVHASPIASDAIGGSPMPSANSTAGIDGFQKRESVTSTTDDEFFVEPEWQRAPGRWTRREEALLKEMKSLMGDDLRRHPPFPEVVGSRRMLRFLRGHKHDVQHAAKMMSEMLKWRETNGVNAIREEIVNNKLFDPSQFPEGEMITKLFPVLVANPLCVDHDGAPISYETYGFSPRQVTAHADGDLVFFIHFHIYCQEFKQICLDSLSDAKEMENLAKIADGKFAAEEEEEKLSKMHQDDPHRQRQKPSKGTHDGNIWVKSAPAATGREQGEPRLSGAENGARGRGEMGATRLTSPPTDCSDSLGETSPRSNAHTSRMDETERGSGDGRRGSDQGTRPEDAEGEEEDAEPWGVVLRNTIIRDLKGFGMEHAGPIGRSLISKVMAVSQDNYPEMMGDCYIINAPWVFYALWKGLTPLMSPNTVKKVKVLNYDFLPTLRKKISLDRLPIRVGGRCDPAGATPDDMEDFVVCGRVAKVAGESDGADEEGVIDGRETAGNDVDDGNEDTFDDDEDDDDDDETEDDEDDGFGSASGAIPTGRRTAGANRGSFVDHLTDSSQGQGRRGAHRGPHGATIVGGRATAAISFRSLFERMGASDGTASTTAALAASISPPRSPPVGDMSAAAAAARERTGISAHSLHNPGSGGGLASPQGLRPFFSPGPRGLRSADIGSDDKAAVLTRSEEGRTEDFDSRVMDRALELSMNRKAQRWSFSRNEGGNGDYDEDATSGPLYEEGNSAMAPSPLVRSSSSSSAGTSEQSRSRAGWVKQRWRSMKERRVNKKFGDTDRHRAISAGDCAEWVPNSERDACLHCERPFTLLLRRHHCRMCGELVCGQCSPHRVRLSLGGGSSGGSSGAGSEGGSSQQSSPRRQRKKRVGAKTVAVRVCTDCHFSLQTVTVASAAALQAGDGTARSAANGDDRLPSRGGGGGIAAARRNEGLTGVVRDMLRDVFFGLDFLGDFGGPTFHEAGSSLLENSDADYLTTTEISGDVVLADVLEWDRVKNRAIKVWEIVLACLFTVIEMHHSVLLEASMRVWRSTIGSMFAAAAAVGIVPPNGRDSNAIAPSSVDHASAQDDERHSQRGERQQPPGTPPSAPSGDISTTASPADSRRPPVHPQKHNLRESTPSECNGDPSTFASIRTASNHSGRKWQAVAASSPRGRAEASLSSPGATSVFAPVPSFVAPYSRSPRSGAFPRSNRAGVSEKRVTVQVLQDNAPRAEELLWTAFDKAMFYAPWSIAAVLGFGLWLIGVWER